MKEMKLFRCFRQRFGFVWPQCLLGLLLVGCGSMQQYEDPINPKKPYAFPGQAPTAPAAASLQPVTSPTLAPAPVSVPVAVMPVIPGSTPPPAVPVTATPVTAIPSPTAAVTAPANATPDSLTVLRSGDTLMVNFSDLPPTAPLQPVTTELDKDGKITLHYNVTVFALGKNTRQLEQEIRAEYVPKFFKYLTVTVKPEMRYFHVNGEVKQPSMYPWKGEPTVLRAIGAAGGLTDWARRTKVQLIRSTGQKYLINCYDAEKDPSKDMMVFPGDYIYVPRKGVFGW